jgi:hypothetical protein
VTLPALSLLSLSALLLWVGWRLNSRSHYLEARRRWLDAREQDLDDRERVLGKRERVLGIEKQIADLTITGLAARVHFQPKAQKEIA